MGGDGSGRKPDVIKMAREQEQFIKTTGGQGQVEIPNYSGLKREVKKQGILNSGTSGSLVWTTSTGEFQTDTSNLYWDETNNRLGIGTTTPDELFDVAGIIGNTGSVIDFPATNANIIRIFRTGSTGSVYPFLTAGNLVLQSRDTGAARDIIFATGTPSVVRMVVAGGGNVGIGQTAPDQILTVAGAISQSNASAPTLTLTVASGSSFISGGAFFYKGDTGTVTLLAAR